MIIHYSFFIFLLLFVPIMVFAEYSVPTEEQTLAETCTLYLDDLSEFPHSRNGICFAKEFCVPSEYFHWLSDSDERIILKNDYTVKQFLYKYPDISLDGLGGSIKWSRHFMSSYLIPGSTSNEGPKLGVIFDMCGNITRYSYHLENSEIIARYPGNDRILKDIKTFEDDKYNVIKAIMQRHPPPAIQMSEFNISLNEVHCNNGLELYIRDNNIPVCLKPQTYEKILERGFNLQKMIS